MLRIGMAQINPIVGDLNGNGQKIIEYILRAKEKGIDILSFPEMAVCGYPPEDLVFKPHFVKNNIETLHRIIKYTDDITVIVGFVDKDEEGNIYNAAGICQNQKLVNVYHKMNLPNYGVFDEKRHFTPGKKPLVFTIDETIIGVNICEDIWIQDGPTAFQANIGNAEIILNISASPYHVGNGKLREEILAKQAADNGIMIYYNNLVGGQDELVFDGGSMVINQQGKVIACGRQFEEDLIIVDPLAKAGGENPLLRGVDTTADGVCFSGVGAGPAPALCGMQEIYQALVLGTHDYVHKNGFTRVVIGLSGGIDSAIVAAIATDALGTENVVGVSMPSQYSSPETQQDAQRLAENLGIEFHIVPIIGIFEIYLKSMSQEFAGLHSDVTEENLQARIRGNIIMAFSNKFGWLVLTTGNKSEIAVGYCTLYGDMAGGFAVIKDVPKTLIYRLAEWRNSAWFKRQIVEGNNPLSPFIKGEFHPLSPASGGHYTVIPEGILTRPPSAELKENQTDQDTLPPYEILDSILEAYIEKDKSSEEIVSLGFESDIVKRVIKMVDTSEYKRRQSSPGIKITPKAFGRDRRLPITNRYVEERR
ncbi:MAG: NAD+ synthase [Candidatus Desantisbacteria bacterium]